MSCEREYTAREQELAQLLVIELLAHQFCSPVKWVDTQDAILSDLATERLIEVGPAETLVNMAKKTMKADYDIQDVALGLRRELLSHKKNADAIYYRTVAEETPSAAAPAPTTDPAPAQAPAAPLTPTDTITVLVAVALKKASSEIDMSQTIKALCGGRSTVQNEIIGDLTKEFGSLPDQPEDIALADLGAFLSDSGLGSKLGGCSNALIAKLASSKLPAGSNMSTLRQYLEGRWSFKQDLQDRTMLLAISRQPASRLADEKAVHAFLDGLAQDVLSSIGVDPQARSRGTQSSAAATATISSEALDALQNEHRSQDRALLNLYAKRLGHDLNDTDIEAKKAKSVIDKMQEKMDAWAAEHGEAYERGIAPKFDAKKVRLYNSFWNWAVQDLLALVSSSINGAVEDLESVLREKLALFPIRVTTQLLDSIKHMIRQVKNLEESPRKEATLAWLEDLQQTCNASISRNEPIFKYSICSMVPVLRVDEKGNISVDQYPRVSRGISDCVSDRSPDELDDALPLSSHSTDADPSESEEVFSCRQEQRPATAYGAETLITSVYSDSIAFDGVESEGGTVHVGAGLKWVPELQSKGRSGGRSGWRRNDDITTVYLKWFQRAARDGISFHDKAILVTGAGRDSIGAEILSMCLAAGAKVIVTTSSYSKETCDYYQSIYRQHGARESQLVVAPFNGGSHQDTQNLIRYIYDDESKGGLGWDLDHVIPFAALGEAGRAVDGIDDKSELAHRVMLTNLIRLLGCIKSCKESRRIHTHPTHVILPLSPNHGIFGQDGLYAESKIGLEALLNKWWSEDWNDYITLCGTVIGWTRGTGLMSNNDVLATGIEADLGVRTFSASEMAWHITGFMDDSVASFCELEPLMADLTGGLSATMSLKPVLDQIQERINSKSDAKRAIAREDAHEKKACGVAVPVARKFAKKAKIQVQDAGLPEWSEVEALGAKLQGMVNLDRIVVAVGFGEISSCGSARTRWEAECSDTFSVDGCVELAWIMGLIKYHNGPLKGKDYCGWLDVETSSPITDMEVKAKYQNYIIEHTGIRIIEKQEHDLTAPYQEQTLHEIAVTEDLAPFDVSLETAQDLKREHGDKVVITENEDGQFSATLKAGTTLLIPKAFHFRNAVGAQVPAGWNPRAYGIPEDIITQVDPITLYALVATVEAFLSAGITDPYELYDHVHVSELGNAVGASLGGLKSLHEMFKRRYLDRQVQKDILAETFVNTTAAWINMLLLGSSGPIRTPVGACATSLESIDTGYDLIVTGKAKAVLVGGTDALERDIAAEFANMQATIDLDKDAATGRTPKEASRPTTTTRAGFVEGEGAGIQLLTTAQLALDMGLPIRGIIALTHTASDKIGRSVPAPGKGVLTIAAEREQSSNIPSRMLDIAHRRQRLLHRMHQIEEKRKLELGWLQGRLAALEKGNFSAAEKGAKFDPQLSGVDAAQYAEEYRREIQADAERAAREVRNVYGHDFWRHEPTVSPLRGALATWGLTVDDLDVASLHGTSTRKNDANETAVVQRQLAHLGRTRGNVLPCVLQKSLLGHGKGAAGAFAVNGSLQMLATGLIPGNRNADNIDAELRDRDLLFFPSRTYRLPLGGDVKAFSVTSFGFGQKGAQVIGVHAKYVLAAAFGAAEQRGSTRRIVKEKSHYADEELEETLLRR
ncbi:fatty acid synthase alpha subunit FasA [Apiospora rasikravindrae]|uniref:beta-ketoacyl-[acyl-carrier-protein] synthase I n=1 Tax=Apiospora rasikravindrae TaxID=990691 RepID=A0ABR1RYE9_9PEZI